MPSPFAKYLDDNLTGEELSKREKAKTYINSIANKGGDSDPHFADKVEDIFQKLPLHDRQAGVATMAW
jgi:hypothetical protein